MANAKKEGIAMSISRTVPKMPVISNRGVPGRGQGTPCILEWGHSAVELPDWTVALEMARSVRGPIRIVRVSDGKILAQRTARRSKNA